MTNLDKALLRVIRQCTLIDDARDAATRKERASQLIKLSYEVRKMVQDT